MANAREELDTGLALAEIDQALLEECPIEPQTPIWGKNETDEACAI